MRTTSLNDRLAELSKLENGWLDDGEGLKITPEAIAAAKAYIGDDPYKDRRLYPTPEGGLQFEWETDGYSPGTKTYWTYHCEPDGSTRASKVEL